jgi:hypothetical protein
MTKPTKAQLDYVRAMGREGGKARAANMTKKERSAAARKAAKIRWAKVALDNA